MTALRDYQRELGRAEGRVKTVETRLARLREQYRAAAKGQRIEITRHGQALHIELSDAKQAAKRAWDNLRAEELRLAQPDSFLAFK